MNEKHIDYLIVGGGIAGTVLALQLVQRGHRVHIYDKPQPMTASRVAAGIINPVTGQRFVKSWMYDDLIAAASKFYAAYDTRWATSFFQSTLIHRALFSKNELNNFENREGDKHYEPYFSKEAATQKKNFREAEEWCTIKGARLDIAGFILQAKNYLASKGHGIVKENFDYAQLSFNQSGVKYTCLLYTSPSPRDRG